MGLPASLEKKNGYDLDINDLGDPDTLRYNALTLVINEEYERAVTYLKDYLERDSVYPNFQDKIERYVRHSVDLIKAIESKRNFPGLSLLPKAKQFELREKYRDHFRELKHSLRKIEVIHEDLRMNDIKSTAFFVRALWLSVVSIAVSAFVIEVIHSMGSSFLIVVSEYIDQLFDFIFAYFNIK